MMHTTLRIELTEKLYLRDPQGTALGRRLVAAARKPLFFAPHPPSRTAAPAPEAALLTLPGHLACSALGPDGLPAD